MIVFEEESKITELDDDPNILVYKLNFVPITNLPKIPKNSNIDVLGVIKEAGTIDKLTLKNGESKEKRTMMIYDETNSSVEVVRIELIKDFVGRICQRRF